MRVQVDLSRRTNQKWSSASYAAMRHTSRTVYWGHASRSCSWTCAQRMHISLGFTHEKAPTAFTYQRLRIQAIRFFVIEHCLGPRLYAHRIELFHFYSPPESFYTYLNPPLCNYLLGISHARPCGSADYYHQFHYHHYPYDYDELLGGGLEFV